MQNNTFPSWFTDLNSRQTARDTIINRQANQHNSVLDTNPLPPVTDNIAERDSVEFRVSTDIASNEIEFAYSKQFDSGAGLTFVQQCIFEPGAKYQSRRSIIFNNMTENSFGTTNYNLTYNVGQSIGGVIQRQTANGTRSYINASIGSRRNIRVSAGMNIPL